MLTWDRLSKIIMVVACGLFLQASVVAAATWSGPWLPNDEDIFAIDVTNTSGSGSLYIYQYGDDTNSLLLFSDGAIVFPAQPAKSATVYFSFDGTDWWMTAKGNTTKIGAPEFGFYFDFGGKQKSYDLIVNEPGESYFIGYQDMWVSVSDAYPVPVPSAVWLLASGLVGLMGLKRKNISA